MYLVGEEGGGGAEVAFHSYAVCRDGQDLYRQVGQHLMGNRRENDVYAMLSAQMGS